MLKYTLNRVWLIFLTLFIILSITFILIRLLPENRTLDPSIPPEIQERINEKYGYDKPIIVQYRLWLAGIIKGDWGISTKYEKSIPTFDVLMAKIPISMMINLPAFFISIPIGFVLGIIAALRKNKLSDHGIMLYVIFFISVPGFVVATLLLYFPAYRFGWFPLNMAPSSQGFFKVLYSVMLPIFALTFYPVATLTRFTRAELTEVLTSEFLLLARTKGLTKRESTVRHAMRNSMVPLVPIVISNFIGIIFGSLVIERIFGIPGVGNVLISAIQLRDYPLIITTLAFYTFVNLFTYLLIDLSYGVVDPRIRMGGKKA